MDIDEQFTMFTELGIAEFRSKKKLKILKNQRKLLEYLLTNKLLSGIDTFLKGGERPNDRV